MVVVSADGLKFELSIVPLNDLRPHEATIPRILDSLTADLKRTSSQRDPILIDRSTRTVLDGMHRRASLEALKANFALCTEFDYLHDSIELERWLRYFIAPNEEFISEVMALLQLKACDRFEDAVEAVDKGKSKIALLSAGSSYISAREWNVFEVYEAIGKIDDLCQKYRIGLDYTSESSKFELFTSEFVYLLYPEKLLKKDVLQIASEGKVFPCKTTRHIVPVRPMGTDFPLDLLKGSSEAKCSKELRNILRLSRIELEKREVWYEGRRYSEPLAIFRREK